MKKSNDVSSLALTAVIVFSFIILAVASTYSNQLQSLSNSDSVYAGTQESIDRTIAPTDNSFFDSEEAVTFTATPFASATTSITRVTAIPLASTTVTPTATPFDFFNSVTTAEPTMTTPPFDLGLPDEGAVNSQLTPQPTVTPAVAQNNNQLLIIGAVVGAIVLILLIVGVILLRRNRNDQPPMMTPGGGSPMPPEPTGPQYPPYINNQQ